MERVIYFLLLERKERTPCSEDEEVVSTKNIRDLCKLYTPVHGRISNPTTEFGFFAGFLLSARNIRPENGTMNCANLR